MNLSLPITHDSLRNIYPLNISTWETEKDKILSRVQKWQASLTDEEKKLLKKPITSFPEQSLQEHIISKKKESLSKQL
jgi:hypothetical protein